MPRRRVAAVPQHLLIYSIIVPVLRNKAFCLPFSSLIFSIKWSRCRRVTFFRAEASLPKLKQRTTSSIPNCSGKRLKPSTVFCLRLQAVVAVIIHRTLTTHHLKVRGSAAARRRGI